MWFPPPTQPCAWMAGAACWVTAVVALVQHSSLEQEPPGRCIWYDATVGGDGIDALLGYTRGRRWAIEDDGDGDGVHVWGSYGTVVLICVCVSDLSVQCNQKCSATSATMKTTRM